MMCLVDLTQVVYLHEFCNKQTLGRLACTGRDMNTIIRDSLRFKSTRSARDLRACLCKYGITSFSEISDELIRYIWLSDKTITNIRIFKEIFDNYTCTPGYLRPDYDYRIYYVKTDDNFHCSSRKNLFMVRYREKNSQMFMQSIGWATTPTYYKKRKECTDYM